MELFEEVKELLRSLNRNKVDYLVVGGYAVILHGHVRNTGDFDIWLKPTTTNKEKLILALEEMGFDTQYLKTLDFEKETLAFHFGEPPERVDFLNKIAGTDFDSAYSRKMDGEVDDLKVHFIGLDDLRRNKRLTARKKDLEDLENLPK